MYLQIELPQIKNAWGRLSSERQISNEEGKVKLAGK